MPKQLAVLNIEDSKSDSDLIAGLLKKAGYKITLERVETAAQMRAALKKHAWDVIISDHSLPQFDSYSALTLLREEGLDIPFIVVSGTIGEEAVVDMMKAGAHDFLIKDNLTRLIPVVERELEYAKVRRERRQGEDALRTSEKRFRALIENGLDDISLLTADGTLIWESPSVVRNLEYTPNEFLGRNIFELMHQDDLEKIQNLYAKLIQKPGSRQASSFRLKRRDGTWRWVEAIATNMLNEPSVQAIVINYRDVTEQRQAENTIRESEDRYRDLVENSQDLICTHNLEGLILTANLASARILGYEPGELIGRNLRDFLIPEVKDHFKYYLSRLSRRGSASGVLGVQTKSGEKRIWEYQNTVRSEGVAEPVVRGMARDITELKQAEEAFNKTRSDYQRLFDHANDVIIIFEPEEEVILEANVAACAIYGFSHDELIGMSLKKLTEDIAQGEAQVSQMLSNGTYNDFESVHTNRNGERIYFLINASIIEYQGKKAILSLNHDITDRKQVENTLNASEARYRSLFEDSPIALWEEDFSAVKQRIEALREQGVTNFQEYFNLHPQAVIECASLVKVLDVNNATMKLFGVDKKDDLSKDIAELLKGEPIGQFQNELVNIAEGKTSFGWEGVTKTLDGRLRNIDLSWRAVPGNENTLSRVIVSMIDITERKRSERALRESEERFHSLFNHMLDGVYRSKHEGKFVDVNPAMVAMFGYSSRQEMLAVDIKNELYFEPEERGSHILDTGQEEMDVYRMRRKDGSEIWVEDHGSYVHDEQGRILFHEGILRDVTERRRSDNFLQTLNNAALATQPTINLDEMFNAVSSELAKAGLSCAILIVDKSGENLIAKYMSYDPSAMRAAEKLTGLNHSSFHIPIKSVDAFRQPIMERRAVFLESISEVLRQVLPSPIKIFAGQLAKLIKIPKTINAPMIMEDKVIGLFSVQSKDLRASDLPAIVALANQLAGSWHRSQLYELTRKEIEERKQSEESLRESEKSLRESQMIAGLGSYTLYIPSENWTSSDLLNQIFGIDDSYDTSVENWAALIHPDWRQEMSDYLANEVLVNHIRFDKEYKIVRKNDGAERWVHGLGKLELDSHNEPIKMRGTIQDITERKLTEEALQKAEIKYRMLVERLPVIVYTSELGGKGAWPYVSPQIEHLLGFTAEEWIADPGLWYQQVHPEDRDRQQKLEDQAWALQESFEGEYRIFTRDGRQIWVRDSAQILPPQNNSGPIVQGVLMDITARKQAEEKLRESEEKYRLLFENNPLPMWIYDLETLRFLKVNDAAMDHYGYSVDEFMSMTIKDIRPSEELPKLLENIARVTSGIDEAGVWLHQKKDGSQIQVESISHTVEFAGRHAKLVLANDITARKQVEQALRESERRFQLAAWATKDVIWERNLLTNMIEWNESLRKIFHFPIEEIEPAVEWWQDHIHPAERLNVMNSIQSAIENRQDFWSKEYRFRLFDGSYAHIFDRGYILYNEQGEPLQMIGAMIDISEAKQAEAALRESEHRYRALFEDMPIAIWEEDFSDVKKHLDSLKEGGVTDFRAYFKSNPAALLESNAMIKVLDVNQATLNLYHADSKDALINSVAEASNERLIDQISDVLTAISEGKSHHTWEGADETVSGAPIEISLSWSVAPGDENDFSKVIVTTIDITKRKLAEEALRASEAQFRAIFEGAAIGIALVDATGHPVKNNSALQEMLGYDSEELLNMVFTDFTHPDDVETDWTLWQELIAGRRDSYQIEKRFIHKTGRVIWVKLATSIVPDADGKILFGVGMAEDITERKSHEREREALASVTQALDQDLDLDVLLQNLLDAALNAVPIAEKGTILLIDAEGILGIRAINGYLDPRVRTAGFPSNSGYSARAVRERRPLIIADARSDTLTLYDDEIEEFREIQSAVVAPLIVKGRAIGAISLDNVTRKEAFSESELTLLSTFANSAALVIQNTRLLEETSQRVVELKLLYESGLAISQLLNPKEIARKIMDLLEQKMNWHHTAIRLYNAADDTLELLAFYQPNIKNDEERLEVEKRFNTMVSNSGEGLSGWVVKHGESVRTGDLINDDRYIETFAGLHSGLYIPIKIGERTIGVISIESEKENAFSRSDEQLTTILAAQAASIFENARLYADISQRASELEQRVEERTAQIEVAKHRLELATSAGQIGVWEYNPMQNKVIWDERMYAIHQVRADKFDSTSQAWARLIHPNDLDESQINDPLAFTQNLLLNNEHRIILPDGSIRYINTNAVAVANEHGTAERVIGISMDITERKQIENSLRESENYARLLFDAIPDPVSVNDINGITVDINRVFENQFRVTRSEMRGRRMSELGIYPESELEKRQKYMDEILQGKAADPVELDYYVPGDRIHTLELHAYPLKVNGRQLVLNTSHDITLRKKAEETQRLAKSEIEHALRIKNEFLGNMSHELRTPLNSILGISESLEEQIVGALNEKQLKYVGIVRESGRHLLELINDILDLTKIEAGRMDLDIHPIAVEKLCQASLRMVKELAQKKSLNVTYILNENVRIVSGDERRLKQCLVNLLSNAVKFTPPGGRIGLEVSGNAETNEVEFTVWDQGIGIAQKDIQYLFKPFVQLDTGLAREYQGTGLGLALVAQMVNLHSGNVRVESEAGSGSRFIISLPWPPDEQTPKAKNTDKLLLTKHGSDKKYTSRILLVEDTDVVIQLISEYLRYRGHEVILAHNGLEAVRLATQERPDLIIMDVMMPIMDGFEATQMIRKDESLQAIPIIALTALAMAGDSERCLAAGMNDYLSKPVQMKDLADMIEKYMGPALESTHDQ